MTALISAGAFCPVTDLADAFDAAGWRVVEPDLVAESAPDPGAVAFMEGGSGSLADLMAATPSARVIVLHASREEAVAAALCDGVDPQTALERWRASALEQAALFRRMRDRVVLVSRRRLETAPAAVLGDDARGVSIPPWRVDPLALALAARMIAHLPGSDAAASMLAACVRAEDRVDVTLDAQEALAAWRDHAALIAGAEAQPHEAADAAAREQSLQEEIGLLRAHLAHLQKAFEAAWLEKEEVRASVSRQPRIHEGLTMPVDLDTAAAP